jgi:epoxyqueuosine reductase
VPADRHRPVPVGPARAASSPPDRLAVVASQAGLDAWGVAEAAPLTRARRALEERKAAGLHGGMQFTYRNPPRATEPGRLVPGARAVVVGARRYRRTDPDHPADPAGAVARYARADHYAALRRSLDEVAAWLRADGWRTAVVCDDNALVDREVAWRAGLGWYGKNANLLLPGLGSWFVLGSVVTDAPLPPAGAPVADGCGACTRCLDACPTGAIVAPGVVDARRCLAWLVQAPGPIPPEHRAALGDRLYGCDDCQEVCPPNRAADRRLPIPAGDGDQAWVGLLGLLAADDEELLAAHGRWYIANRDPRHLRRNALVALGNVGDPADHRVAEVLRGFADGDDELLAEHAGWALGRLAARSERPAPGERRSA